MSWGPCNQCNHGHIGVIVGLTSSDEYNIEKELLPHHSNEIFEKEVKNFES